MMRRISRAVLAAIAGVAAVVSVGSAAAATAPKPLFAGSDVIHLTIKGPIATLRRTAEDQSVAGSVTVQGAAPETLPVALSLRGITRRRQDVCSFPPLRVEFTEKPGPQSLFKGQKRLKLVTHCQAATAFQQYVLLEYAAYRMYGVLSPASLKARLAVIDYVDSAGRPMTSRLGFFIEDVDDMARRNGLDSFKSKDRVTPAQLIPRDAARLAMFEYLISNLDWSMTAGPAGADCCHNARLVAAGGATTGLVPAPYDFDYSGLVDAPYAAPPDGISVSSVRVRRYRGYCRHNAEAQAVAAEMLARRAALLAVLDDTPQLDAKVRQKAVAYLGGFFDQIGSPRDVEKLLQGCVG